MRHMIAVIGCVAALGIAPALAQGSATGPGANAGPSNTTSAPIGGAPVGHRQPTAAGAPAANDPYAPSAQDKELDRKIKGICRGC